MKLLKRITKKYTLLLFVIGGCIFLSAGLVISNRYSKNTTSIQSPVVKKSIIKILARITPTSTPLPTPTPTPTYTGFCLYVPVLMYHHVQPLADAKAHGQTSLSVDPVFFDEQMAAIASRYVSISAQQLVDALRTHTSLPAHAIVVTLDDAYADVFSYAYPIVQKYHIATSLFVPTGLLGGVGNNSYFTWDQLKQMSGSANIFSYDHTWSHYAVGTGTAEKDHYEILTAKQQLESQLGKPVTIFANPYGSGANNPHVIAELQQDGIMGAYSTIPGSYQCDSFLYSLHRTRIGNAPLSAYGL